MPPQRWPLHPTPAEGEALSSWLHRVASCHGLSAMELLEDDLGGSKGTALDEAPSPTLLSAISVRSGLGLSQLHSMSLAGWVPWLLDSLDTAPPDAWQTYTSQLAVLMPERKRRKTSFARVRHWRAWVPPEPMTRACPMCVEAGGGPDTCPMLLAWQLPLMLSCPQHGCWLESYWGLPGMILGWETQNSAPRVANAAILSMDKRTWQALTSGHVDLPRRRIHAGIWFRLLRTVLEELNTAPSVCGAAKEGIRAIWKHCGRPPRAGLTTWRPYEMLAPHMQLQMLEAAAVAMQLIESRALSPKGQDAALFLPEPWIPPIAASSARDGSHNPIYYWRRAMEAIDEAVAQSRRDPEAARMLFAIASRDYRDTPAELARVRADCIGLGIPPGFLSYKQDLDPSQ